MSTSPSPATAETPDYDGIVQVVLRYVDAWKDGDIEKWRESFHEDCWIFCTTPDGSLEHEPISNQFDDWAADTPIEIVGRIISVTQAGDIASGATRVRLRARPLPRMGGHPHLAGIDGEWKITNKTATHCSMAGWAAPVLKD